MISQTLTIVLLAGGGAGILVLAGAGLLAWEASHRDLARHLQHVVRMDGAGEMRPARETGGILFGAIRRVGEVLQSSALFSDRNVADLERTAQAAGLDPRRTVPIVIGGKVLLILGCPVLAYLGMSLTGHGGGARLIAGVVGVAVGMLGPNMVLDRVRRAHAAALQRGLPDALDLLVVCAEAGLGLETAVDRIAVEMRPSNRAIALEFATLGQEMRLSSDRRAVLARMGERTGLEGFQRLAGTLSQTLRYGTPLGQALRVLAAEMRNERMMRLEEKAARLPALLTLPLMLFIMPCLFIVLGGPAVIRILNVMGH